MSELQEIQGENRRELGRERENLETPHGFDPEDFGKREQRIEEDIRRLENRIAELDGYLAKAPRRSATVNIAFTSTRSTPDVLLPRLPGPDIRVYHAGTEYGPYTLAQVSQFLQEGSIDESSFLWQPGQNDWVPLPEFLKLPEVQMSPEFLKSCEIKIFPKKKKKKRR